MEKVKVTREQAEAIESIKDTIRERLLDLRKNPHMFPEKEKSLVDIGIFKIEEALYNGYEVEPEYSKGDYVVWHGLVVNIKHPQTNDHKDDGRCYFTLERSDGSTYENITRDEIRHATPSEIAAEKERRWWSKLDRGNDEYRMTDVVQHKDYKGLYEVVDVYDTKHVEITDDFCDTSLTTTVDKLKLVCPAESRLDVKTNE